MRSGRPRSAAHRRPCDRYLDELRRRRGAARPLLGPWVPTVGNVHEVAHAHNSQARVAYVDWEAIARHHARHILGDEARVSVTEADACEPGAVLAAPGWRGCWISRVRWR
ncbi:SAM-dependent methyltransferase [Salinifilum ghardaiensis]